MRAEHIHIECDEDGFHLFIQIVNGEDDPVLDFRVDDPEALYDAVRSTIGPWLRERSEALRTLPVAFTCTPDESAGLAYDPHDPKGPRFHSTHADIWDAREKG